MEKIAASALHVEVWPVATAERGWEWTQRNDEVIDSALRYRVQAPLIDSILADSASRVAVCPNARPYSRSPRLPGIRKEAAPKKDMMRAAARSFPPAHPREATLRAPQKS